MLVCQILQFANNGTLRWKWRHVSRDGVVTESAETYAHHYECASAARMSGYAPDLKWPSTIS